MPAASPRVGRLATQGQLHREDVFDIDVDQREHGLEPLDVERSGRLVALWSRDL